MRELKSIEEKILDSALYLIGSNGTINVPIRAIAKEAGVNVSAVNYYFGTKEEMLRHTKEFFIENTKRIYSILDEKEVPVEERLILFANEIMEHTLRYTGLTAILKEASRLKEEDETSRIIVEVTKELHKKMEVHLNEVLKGTANESKYNLLIFMSAIIYPAEKGGVPMNGISSLNEKEERLAYIYYLIRSLKRKE
jgi:AcrR family transcriptional regulator